MSQGDIAMNIYQPYTYLIGWSKHNKWYYGVRFAKECHPSDLWVKYFTSSNKVKSLRKEIGDPDIIQVRKIFDDAKKARLWESKVIRRINATYDNRWLNQTDHNDKFYWEGPRGPFTEEHKRKMSETRKGRKISEEHARKLHEGRRKSKNSPEHMEAIRKHNLNKKASPETRLKLSLAKLGKPSPKKGIKTGPQSEERRKKTSEIMIEIWKKRKLSGG